MEIFAQAPCRHLRQRLGDLMIQTVDRLLHSNISIIDASGRVNTRKHIILAQNYYYQQLANLTKTPKCVHIDSQNLFTVISALSACWALGIPVYYGNLPDADESNALTKEFFSFVECIIGRQNDFPHISSQCIEIKTDFIITVDMKIESMLPEITDIDATAFYVVPDDSVWPSGLITLRHREILDQCLYTNKSIGFNQSSQPVHPNRTTLKSLISFSLPALVNCTKHYYDTDYHKRGGKSNYLHKQYSLYKKIGATHVFLSSTANLDILLPPNFKTEFYFVTCDSVDIQTANSLISEHDAKKIVSFWYTESTGVYASSVIDRDNVINYVPFCMQDVDSDISFEVCKDGTRFSRGDKICMLKNKIAQTSMGYCLGKSLTLFEKDKHVVNLPVLASFLSLIIDDPISLVPNYTTKKLHLFVFGADKLDLQMINKSIYSKFIDIETNIEHCIDSIHHIQLEEKQSKPNHNLLLSLASKKN